MSRNPYLAASRPSSSYTRSSRSSTRTGGTGVSAGLLGRSRSSAALGGLGSQSYASSSLYVPQWQRSTSSTRASSGSSSRQAAASSSSYKTADDWLATRATNRAGGLAKSTSSHSLCAASESGVSFDRDDDKSSDSHLKNYQDSKLQQQSQTPRPIIARATRSSIGSLDSENASQSEATRKSSASLADSTGSSADLEESIGDNIPSGSARHLRSSQLSKSKSLELGGSGTGAKTADNSLSDSPLLHGSMSVDRLLLRADSMGERDLRKSFKELVMENERLKQQLKGFDDKDKQRQQEWIRKERQMHRKISELEEENKQLEQWKQEIQRLKDENNSLIRVVSKLTKQHH